MFVSVGAAQKQRQEHVKQKLQAGAALTIKLLEETGIELNSWGSHEVAKGTTTPVPALLFCPLQGSCKGFTGRQHLVGSRVWKSCESPTPQQEER